MLLFSAEELQGRCKQVLGRDTTEKEDDDSNDEDFVDLKAVRRKRRQKKNRSSKSDQDQAKHPIKKRNKEDTTQHEESKADDNDDCSHPKTKTKQSTTPRPFSPADLLAQRSSLQKSSKQDSSSAHEKKPFSPADLLAQRSSLQNSSKQDSSSAHEKKPFSPADLLAQRSSLQKRSDKEDVRPSVMSMESLLKQRGNLKAVSQDDADRKPRGSAASGGGFDPSQVLAQRQKLRPAQETERKPSQSTASSGFNPNEIFAKRGQLRSTGASFRRPSMERSKQDDEGQNRDQKDTVQQEKDVVEKEREKPISRVPPTPPARKQTALKNSEEKPRDSSNDKREKSLPPPPIPKRKSLETKSSSEGICVGLERPITVAHTESLKSEDLSEMPPKTEMSNLPNFAQCAFYLLEEMRQDEVEHGAQYNLADLEQQAVAEKKATSPDKDPEAKQQVKGVEKLTHSGDNGETVAEEDDVHWTLQQVSKWSLRQQRLATQGPGTGCAMCGASLEEMEDGQIVEGEFCSSACATYCTATKKLGFVPSQTGHAVSLELDSSILSRHSSSDNKPMRTPRDGRGGVASLRSDLLNPRKARLAGKQSSKTKSWQAGMGNANKVSGIQGYLKKRAISSGFAMSWKKRFFFLQGSNLVYYENQGDPYPKGSGTILPGSTVDKSNARPHSFIVRDILGFQRPLIAQCESEEECERWITAIQLAINQ